MTQKKLYVIILSFFTFEIIEEMNSYTRAGSVIEIDGTKYLISNTQHQIKSGFHYVKMDVEKL